MPNLTTSRLMAIGRCRSDLLNDGLDLHTITRVRLRALVRTDLEYFQLMLGDESRPGQIIALIQRDAETNVAANAAPLTKQRSAAGMARDERATPANRCPLVGEGHSRSVRGALRRLS
jgi:hypothetical protein